MTTSRIGFAFARDGAIPFSRYIYHIDSRTGTPVNSVWMSAILAALLGLLAFAGPPAIGAIFTLGVVALYTAYIIPITSRLLGGVPFEAGPFNLGKFGRPIATLAVVWMTFASTVLLFPSFPDPGAGNMNYAIVVLGGVITLALLYFYCPS